MEMFLRSVVLLILLIGLMACTPAVPVDQLAPSMQPAPAEENTMRSATQVPTLTSTAAPTVEPTLTAAPPAPVSKYSIDIQFDYSTRRASVEQTVAYANNSGAALDGITLKIEPVNFAGVFELKNLTWQDGSTVQAAEWEGAVLRFPLSAPLPTGEMISFALEYQLYLPRMVENENLRPPIFGYTDRQVNLVDWYPFVPPHTGADWMVYGRGNYGEHLTYDIADYEVNLRLQNAPANMVVAASSAPAVDGDWLRYRLPAARNFVLSLSPDYQVQQGTAGNVTVYSYAFPVHGAASTGVLQTTINALNLYQGLFGPYPHDTMSAVEADFLDGMEYDGLFYLSRGFYNLYTGEPADYLVAIAAHETAHQWWYALIGNNQAVEPWLDEALCTYMEHIYYERYAPEALDWWWAYRVNYYEPRGLIDVSIYDKHGQFQSYRDYRDAVYLNGAVFLHELRTSIGDKAFLAFLRDYAEQHAGGIATRHSFFAVLAEHTSQDLSNLIAKYFK